MVLAYIPYMILLAISPIIGKYTLRFVYPDVKTYLHARKWVLFIIFGLAAYVPAVTLALLEFPIAFYSPFGANPLLLESEGNAFFAFVVFGGIIFINSSIVDFVVVRRKKTTVVGIPKRVIRYSIDKELTQTKITKRREDIDRITGDLETVLKDDEGAKPLIEKIKISVARAQEKENRKLMEAVRAEKIGLVKKPWESDVVVKLPEKEKPGEWVSESKPLRGNKNDRITPILEKLRETVEKEKRASDKQTRETIKTGREAPDDREKLIEQLENRLQGATEDVKKREKSQELLEELKERIQEDKELGTKVEYSKEGIEEITKALREMKEKREEGEEEESHHGRQKSKEDDIGASLFSYEKAYPKRRDDDVLKAVVGDVRQQLV